MRAFIVCSLSDLEFIGCCRRGAPVWPGNQAIVRVFKSKHLCIQFFRCPKSPIVVCWATYFQYP